VAEALVFHERLGTGRLVEPHGLPFLAAPLALPRCRSLLVFQPELLLGGGVVLCVFEGTLIGLAPAESGSVLSDREGLVDGC
jgi:hypothetical protein